MPDHRDPRSIAVVCGTRPEAIKLSMVARAFDRDPHFAPSLIMTGQHGEVAGEVLDLFGLDAEWLPLDRRPEEPLGATTGRLLTALSSWIDERRPDAVVVQGDTMSTLAGAIAGFSSATPVVHVEAGLRSGSLDDPFPEEGNRRMVTQIAALHAAPTEGAARNLLQEGVPEGAVLVTGNTGIDALLDIVGRPQPWPSDALEGIDDGRQVVVVTAHRRESWGEPLRRLATAIAQYARAHPRVTVVWPVHPNPAVRSVVDAATAGVPGIRVVEPLPYGAMARLLAAASVVVTDSGGLQEEAPALGIPLLVTRTTTERPEIVAAGGARLVGCDPRLVTRGLDELLTDTPTRRSMAERRFLFGDGNASARIVAATARLLGLDRRRDPVATEVPPPEAGRGNRSAIGVS